MTPPRTQSKKTSRAVSLSRAFVPLLLTISTPIARPRPRVSPTIERSSHSFTRFRALDRKSTRLNSSHGYISYAVFCLKKKKKNKQRYTRKQPKRHHRTRV